LAEKYNKTSFKAIFHHLGPLKELFMKMFNQFFPVDFDISGHLGM